MAKTTTRITSNLQPSTRPITHPSIPVRERGNSGTGNGDHRGPGPSGSPAYKWSKLSFDI